MIQRRHWLLSISEQEYAAFQDAGYQVLEVLPQAQWGHAEVSVGDAFVLYRRERGWFQGVYQVQERQVAPAVYLLDEIEEAGQPMALRLVVRPCGGAESSAEADCACPGLDASGLLPYLRWSQLVEPKVWRELLGRPAQRISHGDFELVRVKLGTNS